MGLLVLVNQLGGRADPNMIQSDQYRDSVRTRAFELLKWIIDSGDGTRLGLTREDVVSSLKFKSPLNSVDINQDEVNAYRRAENWRRRYNQQNYQAWNTTKGSPYVELGLSLIYMI